MARFPKKKQKNPGYRKSTPTIRTSSHGSPGQSRELRAKSIGIPRQSILAEHESREAAEKALILRKLGLLKHPSALQRKDALNVLRGLLRKSAFETKTWTSVIKAAIPLAIDEDPGVRGALRSMLSSIFAEKAELIEPHVVFIVLYIHSAMTHILPDVRDDSTRILVWLLEMKGDYVVKYAWDKFLDTFSVLFGWKSDENTKTCLFKPTLSQESRYQHFKAFDIFLKRGLCFDKEENSDAALKIYLNQTKYLSGLNHPLVSKYLGLPLKSSPYFHLSLFSQVNNISKKGHGSNYCHHHWILYLLLRSRHVEQVDESSLEQNSKILLDFITRIEITMQELEDNNESVELRKYWFKTGLYKERLYIYLDKVMSYVGINSGFKIINLKSFTIKYFFIIQI
ncbi:hypothetical protein MERGE_002286 [Pneumocystis wakefieldiae]|uniref:Pre-rRNA-processing protein Ipi1 N-terminal domain-containing protein n=1 Tax=Pneumocystis wakefieldiae TaxID=38082 RepID=A0A899FY99_9ASCO|nr:hypothetical protein MERGE_002286 [Pneumocystis wakefieldiae]